MTGTFDAEDGLPRVPVPALADSATQFLEWCDPLLDADQRAETRAAVDQLLRPHGPGPVLQAALEAYDAAPTTHSWLDDFWESRYLGRRDRIALNANFFFLFTDTAEHDQAARAAALVLGALEHKHQVDSGALPPATRKGAPMTMEQHRYLFSSTRIPGDEQDTARTPYTEQWPGPSRARHVLVFVRGHAFRLDVLGPDGTAHTATEIAEGLRAVQEQAGSQPGPGVGRLTTKARAEWAASRRALLDEGNEAALDDVETALFAVALEDVAPDDDRARGAQLLGGDSTNRWFDKSLTFVVFADGAAGINTEHCRLDGTTVLALVDGVLGASTDEHAERLGARAQGVPAPSELPFVVTDERAADIRAAGEDFAAYAGSIATQLVLFDDLGSDRIKKLGASPDAFVQMAYQLAHVRAKGFVGATYESIATLQFHHGRTEAMRVVTPEILAFTAAMDDPGADDAARREAFEAAAAAHVRRAQDCQAGRAPEQHLWELSLIQQRRGASLGAAEPLEVVDSPGWRVMRDDYLSTSSAPSQHVRVFGFGSTSTHCIGVAYVLLPGRLVVHLSTPAAVGEQMERFATELRRAVDGIAALLEG
ncbi:carnitine O-acetyltransferase [Actinomycetospora sp. NBRC 106375]|uniref:choline/carnitine O-acyltransferase n=1 Tax=Actinomycetospora sp. NBRC 106375 TaxID=3032207 RepID=UPI0024A38186|nr:choline/carnitine O-acyltransferase [Actinomycetospora sp. NBRC 106375]GLZ44020.1 carnitine O-acetyltransferase [Actinomycetospora sp. NBRC 106375]